MRILIGVVVAWSSYAFAQGKDLVPPPPEVGAPDAKVDLPALPTFELPPSEPGFVSVPELRVNGKKYLDTEVKVKGYVIWVYDCAVANAKPGESRAQTQKRVDEDPTMCERKKLYVGESPKTPLEKGLWVVSVPRPPNK